MSTHQGEREFLAERELDFAEAIREGLREELARAASVVLFGEDVGRPGGVFGLTKGLQQEFGQLRVRDTPISEAAIIGAAIGSALTGLRPIVEVEFADFIGLAMDQICNQLAKMRYMFGGQFTLPLVIRAACGSRYPVASGAAQHSQCVEAWFMHTPGLKVVVPSTPYDAKGLLKASVRDNDPVLFFEHKLMYYARRVKRLKDEYPTLTGVVPVEDYVVPLGKADIKRKGEDVTIVATMMMVHKALKASEDLAGAGIDVEVIDPRTLVPLDKEAILASVRKTGRVVVASEDSKTGGVAAELAAMIAEEAFDDLDAPVKRVSGLDTPIPYATQLEGMVVPQVANIVAAVKELA
jgi:pyruvate/2-oxoglutarate/acetoin dehydrogenase E1 component